MQAGKVYLIPNTLGGENWQSVIPMGVVQAIESLRFFVVEDIKSARRFLRKLHREFPIDDSQFVILNKRTSEDDLMAVLMALKNGTSVGVISEAGCPGVADPGADLAFLAHSQHIEVVPLVGPSSFLLALMASGFSGQQFTFQGYLPKERKDRIRKMKDMEADCRRNGTTHIFMDTPFRNMNVLEDLLNELGDATELCIASGLTTHQEKIKTMSVIEWRDHAFDLSKIPTVFLIGKGQ